MQAICVWFSLGLQRSVPKRKRVVLVDPLTSFSPVSEEKPGVAASGLPSPAATAFEVPLMGTAASDFLAKPDKRSEEIVEEANGVTGELFRSFFVEEVRCLEGTAGPRDVVEIDLDGDVEAVLIKLWHHEGW